MSETNDNNEPQKIELLKEFLQANGMDFEPKTMIVIAENDRRVTNHVLGNVYKVIALCEALKYKMLEDI